MRDELMAAVLAEHVALLQADAGAFVDEVWLAARPLPMIPARSLLPLLWLARRLHESLLPVPPSPGFRHQLHQELVAGSLAARPLPWLQSGARPRRLWVGAAVGVSVLSLTGVGWWWKRRQDVGIRPLDKPFA